MSNVVYFHGPPAPITRFLRVTEHRRPDQLIEADQLPYHPFVEEAVPEPVRPKHFLDKVLTAADRRARLLAKLKLADGKLSLRLGEDAKRIGRMRDVPESLETSNGSASRSPGFPSANSSRDVKKNRR